MEKVRLDKKKEAELVANAIHEQGKAALSRLEVKYQPHKAALDDYKAKQKAIEEAIKQSFFDACQWLHDVANTCQFATVDEINAFIAEVAAKDLDNTGLELSKDQRLEYGKIHIHMNAKLEHSLQQRIIKDAEEERQNQAALELAKQQEEMRQQQEELQRQQQEMATQRAAEEARVKAEREAEDRVKNAEIEAKQAKEREEAMKKQAEIDAENARLAEIERKKQEEENLKKAAAQAAEQERQRIEAKRIAEEQEIAAREANKRHKGSIHNCIVGELTAKGLSEEDAKTAVKVMVKSQSVTINY